MMKQQRPEAGGAAVPAARWAEGQGPRPPAVGPEQVRTAEGILKKYKDGKTALEARIRENELWYRMRHWEVLGRSRNPGDPEPKSAWLFNAIANKHADVMDNYPTATVLPREETDKDDAEILTSVLPTVLEQCEYEQTYSDMWWYKLKSGTGVTGVFWDGGKQNGLGDIAIKNLDILNLFWEPGVKDIQQSRNVFNVELADREALKERFPAFSGAPGAANALPGQPGLDIARYFSDDAIDTSNKALVVDWYYKRGANGRTAVHYCKFCSGQVLYASENDPRYRERGYYEHGKYPFVFDALFPMTDSPAGFGYIDVGKSAQAYIDKLDQALLKSTIVGAKGRRWIKGDGMVDPDEYADMSIDLVHFNGSGNPNDSVPPIDPPEINPYAITMRGLKVDELKETSGNRDFSQGGAASGVTAASAIAALQEAGSKLSRDMIKGGYRAFAQVGYLCIDLMRQFYTEPRMFRIAGQRGGMGFAQFGGMRIAERDTSDGFMNSARVPYFDIRVVAQKQSPFSTVAQNERARELYGLGFFRPDMADQSLLALEMMQFEGIDNVRRRVGENGALLGRVRQLSQLTLAMAQQLDALTGSGYARQVAAMAGQAAGEPAANAAASPGVNAAAMGREARAKPLEDALNGARRSAGGEARKRAARSAAARE